MSSPALPMPGMRVFELAQRVLDDVVAAALDTSVVLPTKRYVTSGEAVHDCEQVAVTVTALNTGIPDTSGGGGGFPGSLSGQGLCMPTWSATLVVDIVRCDEGLPLDADGIVDGVVLTEALKSVSQDTEVLMDTVRRITTWKFMNFGDVLAAIVLPAPSGGFRVVTERLTVVVA